MKKIKGYLGKLLRKWARRFFERQIRVFYVQRMFDGHDLAMMKENEVKRMSEYMRRDLVRSLIEKIEQEGLVVFEEEDDLFTLGRRFRAKLYVI